MPTKKKGESEKDFVSRCIPIVIKEGTAKDEKQAAAICHSMYREQAKNKLVMQNDGSLHIHIFDEIDQHWGFSPDEVVASLKEAGDGPVTVYINSLGGSVYQGLTIYNLLRSHPGKVTTICTGIAASIAGVIFLAGDERKMFSNSRLMIHLPMFSASGNKKEFQKALELVEMAEKDVLNIYVSRSNAKAETILKWMEEETFLSAEEATQHGFATQVLEDVTAVASFQKLIAHLGEPKMAKKKIEPQFKAFLEDYCEPLGLDVDDLEDAMINKLEARFKKSRKTTEPPEPPESPEDPQMAIKRRRELEAAENDRVAGIQDYAQESGNVELNADYLKELGCNAKTTRGFASHAIREGWSVDKFELEMRRAKLQDIGHVGIVTRTDPMSQLEKPVLTCALAQSAGLPDKFLNDTYDEETRNKADHPHLRGISLHMVLDQAVRAATGSTYPGRKSTDGFIQAVRDSLWKLRAAQNTSWTGLDIFDDLANKMLWAAYQGVATTWQEWVHTVSVSDFKTHNFYRLHHTGGYRQVGADGELKHGGLSDDQYTVAANTFGKIVGLSRRDIINDDLGALNTVMSALGIEGAKFVEEVMYCYLLNNVTTLFPTAGTYNNYISGASTALGVDGLTAGEKAFYDQVDADDAPLMVMPEILLVGTALAVTAKELYEQANLQGLQSANAKQRPDGNPHVGKFRPVVSPYLNNTNVKQRSDFLDSVGSAIPGQSATQWFLFATPNAAIGGTVIGAFLNGQRRPTVEQSDAAFDVLGLLWRAYHDVGAGSGDPKLAVMSKGAA